MSIESMTFDVARKLGGAGIGYMLVGAFSSNQFGIPRSTMDADFVIDVKSAQLELVYELFDKSWNVDDQLTFEAITGSHKLELRHPDSEFVVELFLLSNDPHDGDRWKRRKQEYVGEELFWFPSPEDVVIQKLRWGRSKDLEDVTAVLAVQGDRIDFEHITRWCAEHGTADRLEVIRAKLPPMES